MSFRTTVSVVPVVSVAAASKSAAPRIAGRRSKTALKGPKQPTAKTKGKAASHDSPHPPAFVEFMMTRWKAPARRKPTPVAGYRRHRARRSALAAAFPGEVLLIPTGHEKIRANDTTYPFRGGSDFFYLTGNTEPDCVLALIPRGARGEHEHVLFVEPNPGRTDPTFFTDRAKGELWVGPRLGVAQSLQRFRVDRCEPLSALDTLVARLRKGRGKAIRKPACRLLRGLDAALEGRLATDKQADAQLLTHLSERRLLKDADEVKALERAAAITRRGFDDIVRALPQAKTERQIEAAFWSRARFEGNDVGYNVIAAAGANACILHWNRNDGQLKKGDLLLVDAGVEGDQLYTADVTRALPISGKFSKTQRQIYDLVVAAQSAAIAAIKPGAAFLAPYDAAMQVLARGLERLGILPMSADEALQPDKQYFKRYTLHGVSHMLGIDVHDCSHASSEQYRNGKLRPGMVLTVEPGLYFQNDDLTVPERYRGIGIRIEDDVLVTARGARLLTDVPRRAADVESWMRDIWAERRRSR